MAEQLIGVVDRVVLDGNHGPYALAKVGERENAVFFTFSLEPPVWNEGDIPDEGMQVVLSKLRKKRAGWRALSARYLQTADEQHSQHSQKLSKEQ